MTRTMRWNMQMPSDAISRTEHVRILEKMLLDVVAGRSAMCRFDMTLVSLFPYFSKFVRNPELCAYSGLHRKLYGTVDGIQLYADASLNNRFVVLVGSEPLIIDIVNKR